MKNTQECLRNNTWGGIGRREVISNEKDRYEKTVDEGTRSTA